MSPSILATARSNLVQQLVYFDEEKMRFLDHFFPNHGKERTACSVLLTRYVEWLEQITADLNEEILRKTVLIGSKVTTVFMEDDMEEHFSIVFPHQADPDRNSISFLSPIGSQLLMAAPEEVRTIEIPSGRFSVKLKDIEYACLDELEYI